MEGRRQVRPADGHARRVHRQAESERFKVQIFQDFHPFRETGLGEAKLRVKNQIFFIFIAYA